MANSETKICQNCKKDFVIEPDDFDFYEKIKVPSPTFCPECRLILRLNWRNERSLYWRECGLCGEKILSVYNSTVVFPVYCHQCYWSDKWDGLSYGRLYDFSKPFFEQFNKLQSRVPHLALNNLNIQNSPYVNQAWNSKNSYMCFDLGYGENVLYSKACHFLKDTLDCTYSKKLELCHSCINTKDSSRSVGLFNCEGCVDSYFLKNCKNCSSCILCVNLRNKNYHILNKPYTKEEFEKAKNDFINGSYQKFEKNQELLKGFAEKFIHKENENLRVLNCTGNYIWDSKNCHHCFNVFKSENCKFANDIDSDVKDAMDLSHAAEGELMYNGVSVSGTNVICGWMNTFSLNVRYCISCLKNVSNIFGCIGLMDKQNCILNKQYSKEEYENLLPQIIEHMGKMPYLNLRSHKFVYGDYFPSDLSAFAYNETTAQEYFPLTKEQALERGYNWKDPEPRSYKADLTADQLPDHIKDVKDDIVGQVIECGHKGQCNEQCTEAFRIIPQELQFYRRMNLPLPRLCPNCRHYQRLKQRNPLKLWKRQCQRPGCTNTFETSYAPNRPEIVYCEGCYLKEVV